MNVTHWIGRLLGLKNVDAIERIDPSLAASWAHDVPLAVLLACLTLFALAIVFYARWQPTRHPRAGLALGVMRAVLLCLVLLCLAEPTLVVKLISHPRPMLWLLFDGSDSMAIEDDLSPAERARLRDALHLDDASSTAGTSLARSRAAYVQALLTMRDQNLLKRLEERFRLRAYLCGRPDGVTALQLNSANEEHADPAMLASQLTTKSQVTALGAGLADLAQRHSATSLAGVVMFSDFDQNAGPSVTAGANQLGVPVYAVGVGPSVAVDLSVDIQADVRIKKGEQSTIRVTVRQTGLEGKTVPVRLTARRVGGAADSQPQVIGERDVPLASPFTPIEFAYTPQETGRFVLTAEVDPQEGEVVKQNNHADREVTIRDDFLRLMFVENEPTWEWRFIKEVFHRDKLVGMRGFRTYLRSADPKVRQTNELFLPTMTPPRSDFFANDVIFLGDMPASTLSSRFCEMVKEFVHDFGGGLVVLSGPNYGPGQLAGTPLADLLPVVVDPDARLRDSREFTPRLTPLERDFMTLGRNQAENQRAWNNLAGLPWYQPVARVPNLAEVLLEHPTDTCVDGKTRQPLVAIRRYGRGEVVYLAMNETWRLRRKYGENYYRKFWGQMIYRLALGHELGNQKRFVVRTDRQQYQADEKAVLTVEAYDENFKPLTEDKLIDHALAAEIILPTRGATTSSTAIKPSADGGENRQPLPVPQLRTGVFEVQIPVFAGGEYRVRVKDPITAEVVETSFQVTSLSAERLSAVRNVKVQEELARATGGKSYDLATVSSLPEEIKVATKTESSIEIFPLWNTWFAFILIVGLMLCEWLARKLLNLA
jgi:hypothetical protein